MELQYWTKQMEYLEPPSPQIKDEKMARFGFRLALSSISGGIGVCCSILFCPRSILDRTDEKFSTTSSPNQGWKNGASRLSGPRLLFCIV